MWRDHASRRQVIIWMIYNNIIRAMMIGLHVRRYIGYYMILDNHAPTGLRTRRAPAAPALHLRRLQERKKKGRNKQEQTQQTKQTPKDAAVVFFSSPFLSLSLSLSLHTHTHHIYINKS